MTEPFATRKARFLLCTNDFLCVLSLTKIVSVSANASTRAEADYCCSFDDAQCGGGNNKNGDRGRYYNGKKKVCVCGSIAFEDAFEMRT